MKDTDSALLFKNPTAEIHLSSLVVGATISSLVNCVLPISDVMIVSAIVWTKVT